MEFSPSASALCLLVGDRIRTRRKDLGYSRDDLSARSGVSTRYLAHIEEGSGNVSLAKLLAIAESLQTTVEDLVRAEGPTSSSKSAASKLDTRRFLALLGIRGAGKSSVGAHLAKKLGAAFVELDEVVSKEAGMTLQTLFEIHGEAKFREKERAALDRIFQSHLPTVIATSGSIVSDRETFSLLQRTAQTVWLKARPIDHWNRVMAQGDMRPMRGRSNAKQELDALFGLRAPLYAHAHWTIDTTSRTVADVAKEIAARWVA